jgi:hypothetical protein
MSMRALGHPSQTGAGILWLFGYIAHYFVGFTDAAPLIQKTVATLMNVAFGTSVWTGRAVQAGCDDLEIIGLAHLYSAR